MNWKVQSVVEKTNITICASWECSFLDDTYQKLLLMLHPASFQAWNEKTLFPFKYCFQQKIAKQNAEWTSLIFDVQTHKSVKLSDKKKLISSTLWDTFKNVEIYLATRYHGKTNKRKIWAFMLLVAGQLMRASFLWRTSLFWWWPVLTKNVLIPAKTRFKTAAQRDCNGKLIGSADSTSNLG